MAVADFEKVQIVGVAGYPLHLFANFYPNWVTALRAAKGVNALPVFVFCEVTKLPTPAR